MDSHRVRTTVSLSRDTFEYFKQGSVNGVSFGAQIDELYRQRHASGRQGADVKEELAAMARIGAGVSGGDTTAFIRRTRDARVGQILGQS